MFNLPGSSNGYIDKALILFVKIDAKSDPEGSTIQMERSQDLFIFILVEP